MALSEQERHKVKKFIKALENFKGRHTELVSVYVPAGYDLNKIVSHLSQEQGTATNIKSSATKKNVIGSLERMLQHLKLFTKTPTNGLAIFAGNVAERDGQQDIQVWSIEPPVPLKIRIYRCDKDFVMDPLNEMCDDKNTYGLVVLDRRDANIALLRGKAIIPLVKTHSEVPGKFKAGGQSAQRFERNRELSAIDHYKKVADYMKDQFLMMENLKGIIVGGPGPTKYDFVEGGYITNEVRKKIIAVKDLSYTEEFGLQELVDKSEDVLAQEDIMREKEIMSKFFNLLSKDADMVNYGKDHVMESLKMGMVEELLLSEDLDDTIIENFEEEAKLFGAIVHIISTETREGVQLKEIGKVAAILRYKLNN
jgi:peptide chain release factor subunit 1